MIYLKNIELKKRCFLRRDIGWIKKLLDCLDDMEGDVVDFLNHMSTDCNGRNLHKESDESFELYVDIARDSRNAIPHELLLLFSIHGRLVVLLKDSSQ